MHPLRDGDDVIVRRDFGDGEIVEERIEFGGLIVDPDGGVHVEHYLYRPDGCSDTLPLDQVRGMRRVPRESEPIEVDAAGDRPDVGSVTLSVGERPIARLVPVSGRFVVELHGADVPLEDLRGALEHGERLLREHGYGDDAPS